MLFILKKKLINKFSAQFSLFFAQLIVSYKIVTCGACKMMDNIDKYYFVSLLLTGGRVLRKSIIQFWFSMVSVLLFA